MVGVTVGRKGTVELVIVENIMIVQHYVFLLSTNIIFGELW